MFLAWDSLLCYWLCIVSGLSPSISFSIYPFLSSSFAEQPCGQLEEQIPCYPDALPRCRELPTNFLKSNRTELSRSVLHQPIGGGDFQLNLGNFLLIVLLPVVLLFHYSTVAGFIFLFEKDPFLLMSLLLMVFRYISAIGILLCGASLFGCYYCLFERSMTQCVGVFLRTSSHPGLINPSLWPRNSGRSCTNQILRTVSC